MSKTTLFRVGNQVSGVFNLKNLAWKEWNWKKIRTHTCTSRTNVKNLIYDYQKSGAKNGSTEQKTYVDGFRCRWLNVELKKFNLNFKMGWNGTRSRIENVGNLSFEFREYKISVGPTKLHFRKCISLAENWKWWNIQKSSR